MDLKAGWHRISDSFDNRRFSKLSPVGLKGATAEDQQVVDAYNLDLAQVRDASFQGDVARIDTDGSKVLKSASTTWVLSHNGDLAVRRDHAVMQYHRKGDGLVATFVSQSSSGTPSLSNPDWIGRHTVRTLVPSHGQLASHAGSVSTLPEQGDLWARGMRQQYNQWLTFMRTTPPGESRVRRYAGTVEETVSAKAKNGGHNVDVTTLGPGHQVIRRTHWHLSPEGSLSKEEASFNGDQWESRKVFTYQREGNALHYEDREDRKPDLGYVWPRLNAGTLEVSAEGRTTWLAAPPEVTWEPTHPADYE